MKDKEKPIEEELPQRRSFLLKIWLVLGGIALAEFVWVVVSFFRPRQNNRPRNDTIMTAGKVGDYAFNSVTAFPRGQFYLTRIDDGGFLAISRRCTHLGCTVPWFEKEKKFVCPCHSSVFDISGAVVQAPAPRALDLYRLWIENEVIFVDTSRPVKRETYNKKQVVYHKNF